ncbi:Integral membrane protein 2C [Blomia tropicalis]|nr:Integral membrane protein 2C [Blomia tropicalis]
MDSLSMGSCYRESQFGNREHILQLADDCGDQYQSADSNYIDIIRCPVCKSKAFRIDFTCTGIILAIVFFPLGLFFCILLTEKHCLSCDFRA